ncbi:MAG: hypothetical protein PHZ00_03840 [Candidatus Peribacteraceae bacterium]|nr:hypothetical protein [Candidatus Peribacteraceae bacterium]
MLALKPSSPKKTAIVRQIFFWFSNFVLLVITIYSALMMLGFAEVWLSDYPNQLWSSLPGHSRIMLPYYVPAATVIIAMLSAFDLILTKRSASLLRLLFAVELPLVLIEFSLLAFNIHRPAILLLSPVILCCCMANWFVILWGQKYALFHKRMQPYFNLPFLVSSMASSVVFFIGILWIQERSGWRIMRFLLEENTKFIGGLFGL